MKSKVSNSKKGKAAAAAAAAASSVASESSNVASSGASDSQKGSSAAAPSAGTSSATTSSSLSNPTPSSSGTRPSDGASGSSSSTGKGSGARSKGGDKSGGSGTGPTYPILTHYNLGDFPKLNACINGGKGSGSSAPTPGTSQAGSSSEACKPLESLSMEDVDTLQAELETLWSSVATRHRIVKREIANLQSAPSSTSHHNLGLEHFDPQHQEKIAAVDSIIGHGTRTSVSAAAKLVMGPQLGASSPVPSPSTSAQAAASSSTAASKKAGAGRVTLPKKKIKGESGVTGKAKKGGDKPAARATATQNRTPSVSSDLGADGLMKQHEIPNKFWESVEEYCRPVTEEDSVRLQGLIDNVEKLPENTFTIPPLGKHFLYDAETAKRKARESRIYSAKDQVGIYTQRVVAAIVDDKVAEYNQQKQNRSPTEAAATASPSSGSLDVTSTFVNRPGLVSALGLDSAKGGGNSVALESKVQEVLLKHGFLLQDDAAAEGAGGDDPDDAVLSETKRTQSLLKRMHGSSGETLVGLKEKGRKEMRRYEYQRQLDKADKDLIEAYKIVQANRQKKKPVTKKERDACWKALEARKKAIEKLDGIPSPTSSADISRATQIMSGLSGLGPSSSSSATASTPMDCDTFNL